MRIWLELVNICKYKDRITHVCFILLTLVGSLNTRLIGLVLKKNSLRTWQMLMHEKTCVIPTLSGTVQSLSNYNIVFTDF